MTDEHIRTVQPTWLEVPPIKDTANTDDQEDTPWPKTDSTAV